MTLTEHIEIAGRRLRWLARLLVVATLAASAAEFAMRGPLALLHLPPEIHATELGGWRAVAAGALGMIVPVTYLVVLAQLDRLAGLYASGEVFSAAAHRALRRIGWTLIAVDGVEMLRTAATGPLLTVLGATPGYLEIELRSSMLIVGALVVVISRVMELARMLHENEQLTI